MILHVLYHLLSKSPSEVNEAVALCLTHWEIANRSTVETCYWPSSIMLNLLSDDIFCVLGGELYAPVVFHILSDWDILFAPPLPIA